VISRHRLGPTGSRLAELCDPKIHDFHNVVARYEDVAGFQVAVEDP
jgi:hypothetical protein